MKTSIICGIRYWSTSVTCRLACAWRHWWMKFPKPELHSRAISYSTLYVIKATVFNFCRSGCRERSLSLSLSLAHLWFAQFVLAQTFSVHELLGTSLALYWWGESHSPTICLCRQTSPNISVDPGHLDLHRFHLGLFEAPQHPIVARVPLHFMPNDANHGHFRRLFGRDILQTLATNEGVEFCFGFIATRQD